MKKQGLIPAVLAALLVPASAHADLIWAGTNLVNLDATGQPLGALAIWTNAGTLGNFAASGAPAVAAVGGVNAVVFNGTSDYYTGPSTVAALHDAGVPYTIEAWVNNPAILGEETIAAWARRGGPNGTNVSFNYGTDGNFGAMGHWGGPDLSWNGAPAAGQWHHLVYTYDGNQQRVYADGLVRNHEIVGSLDPHNVDTGSNPLPIRIASQNEANGTPTVGLRGSLSLARLRIHSGALTATQIAANYNEEAADFSKSPVSAAGLIGDWNFSRDANGNPVTNGQEVPAGGAESALLHNAASSDFRGQRYETPHYRTYNPAEIVNKVGAKDGWALATGGAAVGEGYIYFNGRPTLSTNDDFTVWARLKRQSDQPGNSTGDEFIFSRPNRWDLSVNTAGVLDVDLGGIYGNSGVPIVVGRWYDIAMVFNENGPTDTISLFVDGLQVGSYTGNAVMDMGDWFHIGAGPGGTADFHGLFDRVQFFNQALDADTISRMTVPEPASMALLGLAACGLGGYFRRRRKA